MIESEGNDFTATEVSLRKKIDALGSRALADRRSELAAEARGEDPRRDRLEREIEDHEGWEDRFGRERAAIEATEDPPADELARMSSIQAAQAKVLRGHLAQLARLPDSTATAEAKPLGPAARLEAALIEKRIERNVRREVRASQLDPSQVIYAALGPFPVADPDKAVAWDDGAHAIATYRHRHDIDDEADPLGRQPRRASARAERARAQRRLKTAQRRPGRGVERTSDRVASR